MKGFTLIEVVIALAIFTTIALAISLFTLDISNFSVFFGENLSAQQELQLSLLSMAREIRAMGPSSTGSYQIASATANSVTFYSDSDDDGLFERLRYFMDGDIFKKGVIKPSGNPLVYDPAQENVYELVHYVTNGSTVFTYYDKNFTGTQPPLSFPVNAPLIKAVKASLVVDQNAGAPPLPLDFSITATARNFKQ